MEMRGLHLAQSIPKRDVTCHQGCCLPPHRPPLKLPFSLSFDFNPSSLWTHGSSVYSLLCCRHCTFRNCDEDTVISSFALFSQAKELFFGLIVCFSWLTRVLFLLYFIECPIILLYYQYRCT